MTVEEARIDAEVTADTVHLVGLQYALLVVEARRDTIGELACCTADAEVVVTAVGQLIDLILPVCIGRAKLRDGSGVDTLNQGTILVCREDTYTASSFGERALHGDSDLGLLPDLTTLRGDHDHTIGSTRTVDSRSRSILQHVHRSDVLRVDGAEDTRSTSYCGVLDGYPVDDDQWVVACVERSTATDTDTTTGTRRAVRGDLHPSDLPYEEFASSRDSPLLEVLLVDGADGAGEVLLLHRAVADDYNLLEALSALLEDDLQGEGS